jgi:hypothetical protein
LQATFHGKRRNKVQRFFNKLVKHRVCYLIFSIQLLNSALSHRPAFLVTAFAQWFDRVFILLILFNTIALSMEYHGMPKTYSDVLCEQSQSMHSLCLTCILSGQNLTPFEVVALCSGLCAGLFLPLPRLGLMVCFFLTCPSCVSVFVSRSCSKYQLRADDRLHGGDGAQAGRTRVQGLLQERSIRDLPRLDSRRPGLPLHLHASFFALVFPRAGFNIFDSVIVGVSLFEIVSSSGSSFSALRAVR